MCAVRWAAAQGIVNGYSDGYGDPMGTSNLRTGGANAEELFG